MYYLYKGNPYTINCDWLQYSVLLDRLEPTLKCPPGYRVELCQGNNVFENRALIFDQAGRKNLTLLWKPYSSTLNKYIMTVQVANESLYSGEILTSLNVVKQIVPCIFNSIGRFDICCDFTMSDKKLQMVKHLNSGHYYVERKKQGSSFWHEVERNGYKHKQTHCLSWGSKSSEIKVKLYNKSRELGLLDGDEPEKPWIVKEWKEIGIDIKKAWRLEFSLTTNGQLYYNDNRILLENIASPSWLMGVYSDFFYNRFVTRINQGKKQGHHNNDERVYLFEMPKDMEKVGWKSLGSHATESMPAVLLLRSMLRQLNNEALVVNEPLLESYTNTLVEVVSTHHLEEYFERTFQVNAIDFVENIKQSAGEGINFQIAPISKFID